MQSIEGKGLVGALRDPQSAPLEENSPTPVFSRTRNPPGVLVTTCAQVLNQPYAVAQDWLNRQMDGVDTLGYLWAVFRLKSGLDPTGELITTWAQSLGLDPHVVQEWVEEQESPSHISIGMMSSFRQGHAPPPPQLSPHRPSVEGLEIDAAHTFPSNSCRDTMRRTKRSFRRNFCTRKLPYPPLSPFIVMLPPVAFCLAIFLLSIRFPSSIL
ncbi:hypothetical protein BDZ89DRAFT_1136492 [Hymenopellis radicata]|nr:hypothetical protein BDZ89DRAFT_1136492 [Hymenopellis radicata]